MPASKAFTAPIAVRLVVLAVVMAMGVLPARPARANGAFPDSLQIVLPADRPAQIILATNFGLIISDDDGASWNWTCEQVQTQTGFGYAIGPAPQDRLYSLSPAVGLALSDDVSCSWTLAGGALGAAIVKDYFPDPTDASRVLAIAASAGETATYQLFASHDGGQTFDAPFYVAPAGATLTGVESARSDPATIYAAMYTTTVTSPSIHPKLLRSSDGGQSFATLDVEPTLGPNKFRIIAVDPTDPLTITLRLIEMGAESVVISRDGGATFGKPITVPDGVISAYARLASGTLLVGAVAGADALGFRSSDGGLSFQPWANVPHLRALAERNGKLYAAPNNYSDKWAIGVSTDEGLTFTPLTTYDKVSGIRPCAKVVCEDACDIQAGSGIWPPTVCHPEQQPPPPPPKKGGSGCRLDGRPSTGWAEPALVLAALAALALGRRRRAKRLKPRR